ncbi:capsule assembly Wzi family protein [Deminuibacter soli]|nr:capsule assembly Wzi family protein [Deminuibacter soli]
MGQYDITNSLSARPFYFSRKFTTDSLYRLIDSSYTRTNSFKSHISLGKSVYAEILPVSWQQQYNSHHPYGWSDGAMIPGKGYQTMVSAGVFIKAGPLSVQLRPEFVYAANPRFAYNSEYGGVPLANYKHLFPGQSSIRLTVGPVSAGISTENMWWGPGVYNSLVMTNNAPGMPHLVLNSSKPLKTGIGSFEWELVAGKLVDDSKNILYQNYYMKPTVVFGFPADTVNHDWRYFNGIVLTYSPKWTPGLFLGITRAFQTFHNDLQLNQRGFFNKYLPVISPFQKDMNENEDSLRRDQVTSLFLRWVFPRAQFEVYGEYGFNDHAYDTRDFFLSPTHAAAYVLGLKKIFPLHNNQRLETGFELTQLQQSPDYLVREAYNWYWHGQIYQGYTNYNQILGSGIGAGNNLQTFTATWVKGFKRLGIMLERMENDPIYHNVKWTDMSVGFNGQIAYRHWLFSGLLQFVSSHNYAWEKGSAFNFHGIVTAGYRL